MAKFTKIALPEFNLPVQMSLLASQTPQSSKNLYAPFPRVHRQLDALSTVLNDCTENSPGLIGMDMEYDTERGNKPSILGLSGLRHALSVPWSEDCVGALQTCISRGLKLVAYSTMSADKPCVDPFIKTHRADWLDAMLSHYLAHQDLCKRPSKGEDDEPGALGFMNLWTAYSLVGDAPNWKRCRGIDCFGPCPSHDVWSYNASDAWAGLVIEIENGKVLKNMGVPSGFQKEMLELSELCVEMERFGIGVDREIVTSLDATLKSRQAALFKGNEPFNPKSPKAVVAWFKTQARLVKLPELGVAKNDKGSVQDAVISLGKRYLLDAEDLTGIVEGIRNAIDVSPPVLAMCDLLDYKVGGKGLKAWFDQRYFGSDKRLHPRSILTGTSTGRLSMSRPNFQNVPKLGWGEQVRAAVIARPGYQILRADFKQLELRMVLYLAGVDPADIGKDAFTWLVGRSGGAFSRAAAMTGKSERDIAKRISHAGDYGEGIQVLTADDLDNARTKATEAAGALKIYRDWEYAGGVIAFTGVNLAEALFGDKSWSSRAKALEIQENVYFANFSAIRKWQREVLAAVEARGYVKYPTGRFLRLSGSSWDEESRPQAMTEDAKIAFAALGSGVSADHVQAVMLKLRRLHGDRGIPMLQVHDELLYEVPLMWGHKTCADFIRPMIEETWRLPGFSAPISAGLGVSWLEAMQAADDLTRRLQV